MTRRTVIAGEPVGLLFASVKTCEAVCPNVTCPKLKTPPTRRPPVIVSVPDPVPKPST